MSQKRFISKNGLDNNNQTIINVADPVNNTDAATKNITDSIDSKANSAYFQANSAYAKANSVVLTITGTANQILANSSTGNVLLSLPSTINVNSNSSSSINLTANNNFSGNTYISWSFNSSGNNTLPTTANLTFTPSSGVLRSTGFAAKAGLLEHANIIGVDYEISDGYNAISGGPVTIANNIVVTIPTGSTWTII